MTTVFQVAPTNAFEPFERGEIHQGIHQRFEKQAAKYSSRRAIRDAERDLSYAEANNAANNMAHAILKKAGAGPGQVAFTLQNDAYAIIALLGILKARKAYVPLDPLFPKDRTAFMLAHSESSMILTDHAHKQTADEISGGKMPMLLMEDIDLNRPAGNPNRRTEPESLAYILYTSGTTGKPKGIAFGHRNLLHTTMCLINNLHICVDDRMTQLHSTSFAASVVDIYCALLNGASVYPWDVKARGISGLAKWLVGEEVTTIQWIPTPFRQLMGTLEPRQAFRKPRLLIMASEPLTRREFDLYQKHFPDECLLVNQMGTSESYNYHLFFANKDTVFQGDTVPAGFPVSEDREILLLDEDRKEVSAGEVGEIAIRSEFMSLGYWRNPELTGKVFIGEPNSARRTYLTGDLGKRVEGDCLIHLGRKDFQVKIRGYRIELPEVEFALKGLDHIGDVAVMARTDRRDELKLVAYYISDDGRELSVTELRRELAKRLPDYMIPHAFVRMAEFPMTPSGKIEKNSLPSPEENRPVVGNDMVAPRTALEGDLAEIWRQVLGCREVGVTDNFFDLGGDSLQAAQVLYLVSVRCGVDLGYSALVSAPRIADLATLIERAKIEAQAGLVGFVSEKRGASFAKENPLRGLRNRFLQVLALYAPGFTTVRVWLHRWRGVRIGRNVAIGTSAIIETAHPELVWIGDNVAIGIRNVIIGHFSDSIDRNRSTPGPTVRICNNVYIGPNVTVLPNVTIGEGAVVTAGSVVNKSVAPGIMVQGNPAVPIARCGVPLVGKGRTYEDFLRHLRVLAH